MRGTEEMSMVSTYCRAISESTDMALLELTEIPPIYYRPYYAGWNATTSSSGTYACIQHPGGATKRFSLAEKVQLDSFKDSGYNFASIVSGMCRNGYKDVRPEVRPVLLY